MKNKLNKDQFEYNTKKTKPVSWVKKSKRSAVHMGGDISKNIDKELYS